MGDFDDLKYRKGFDFDPVYGIKEDYGDNFLGMDYRIPSGEFGFPTDPTTANQIQSVSSKISTGTKVIEFSGLGIAGSGGPMAHLDKIPKQHLEEVRRLRELTGVDMTFHGPLVEPTGAKRGWNPGDRVEAEKNMTAAVKRAHELDPKGNIVVTFHSSNGLPQPETYIIDDDGKKQVKEFWVINEQVGDFQNIAEQVNYLKKDTKFEPEKILKKQNDEGWFRELQGISFHAHQGVEIIDRTLGDNSPEEKKNMLEAYKKFGKGEENEVLKEYDDKQKQWLNHQLGNITHGDVYLRDAYFQFQNLFNRAYATAERNKMDDDLKKLQKYRDEMAPMIKQIEEDPSKVQLLGQELIKGVNVLKAINPPQVLKPLREWAIDQASTSFANTAFDSYKEFKNTAPIISIENPPAGMGLSRAEDLRLLVDAARDKFVDSAVNDKDLRMSRPQAEEAAKKLIGVTWDVGHINMIRGQGFSEKDVVKETEKISKYVKHVHLSDNFGMEHTELPMGMGNVPVKKMLDLIHKYNDKVKKIVETGDWYSRQGGLGQTQTPMRQTLTAFGSPTYGNMGPYWNQAAGISSGYFSGIGATNPDIHHALYGSGFSNLPLELGGQMAGRSRASGAPIE